MSDDRRRELFETIRDYITDSRGEDRFESLALEVFRFQYGANEAYRAYCDGKGINCRDWPLGGYPRLSVGRLQEEPGHFLPLREDRHGQHHGGNHRP